MEFYSAIKKDEVMSFAGKCMELDVIMLSEISKSHKDKYHLFSLGKAKESRKTKVMKLKGGLLRR
jgi:hypothetical protein